MVITAGPLCEVYSDRKRMICCEREMDVVMWLHRKCKWALVMKEKSWDLRQYAAKSGMSECSK